MSAWRIDPTSTTLAEGFAIPANDTILLALWLPAPGLLAAAAIVALLLVLALVPTLLHVERRRALFGYTLRT